MLLHQRIIPIIYATEQLNIQNQIVIRNTNNITSKIKKASKYQYILFQGKMLQK